LPPPDGAGWWYLGADRRLFLDGDQGRKLSAAEMDFVLTRELAHIARFT